MTLANKLLIPLALFIAAVTVLGFAMLLGIRDAKIACADHGGYSSVRAAHIYCEDGTIIHYRGG